MHRLPIELGLVVFNPGKRIGVLLDGGCIVDLQAYYARFLADAEDEDACYEAAKHVIPSSLEVFIACGKRAIGAAKEIEKVASELRGEKGLKGEKLVYDLSEVSLLPPLPSRGSKIICIGGNFASHFANVNGLSLYEAERRIRETPPWGFVKDVALRNRPLRRRNLSITDQTFRLWGGACCNHREEV